MAVSLHDQIAAAARELAMRRGFYAKAVAKGSMKQADADHQLACAAAWVESLTLLGRLPALLVDLRGHLIGQVVLHGAAAVPEQAALLERLNTALDALGVPRA